MNNLTASDLNWYLPSTKPGGKNPSYDVMITITRNGVKNGEPHRQRNIQLSFRNRAADRIEAEQAKELVITQPTSTDMKIYFQFLNEPYYVGEDKRSRTLTKDKDRKNYYRAVLPFVSQDFYEIIVDKWVGEYKVEYDKSRMLFYIRRRSQGVEF